MLFSKNIPDWLVVSFRTALLGEIYSNIRAIAVGYDHDCILIRYYLDREPIDFDWESVDIVAINLDATVTEVSLSKIDVECIYALGNLRDLPSLSGFIYARREGD